MKPVSNPPNPWATSDVQYLPEYLAESAAEHPGARLEVYEDHTREIIARNNSPDVGFDFSVNPYRGCQHACAYCYARPGHEYLSLGAGTDFETKITVKPRAPELLRAAFERPSWRGDLLAFSGVTDCYQPLEASYRLTRGCLEVCAEYKNPVAIITKAPLIERDLDVLLRLQEVTYLSVAISIPFWDEARARAVEPLVATPERRMRAVARLAAAGIPVAVMVAPIIPGLNDEDMPQILEAARAAGARRAGYVLLRLPGSVKAVFEERIRAAFPDRGDKILHRVRDTRGGALYDTRFGVRQRGEGVYADLLADLFEKTARRLGLWPDEPDEPEVEPDRQPAAGPRGDARLRAASRFVPGIPTTFARPRRRAGDSAPTKSDPASDKARRQLTLL